MLSLLFAPLGWQFLGDALIMAITVLCSLQNPEAQMSMYGLAVPYRYLPFAQLVMSYMFTQQIPWQDIVGSMVGYAHYALNDNCKPDAAVAARAPKAGSAKAGRTVGGGAPAKKKPKKNGLKTNTIKSTAACGSAG